MNRSRLDFSQSDSFLRVDIINIVDSVLGWAAASPNLMVCLFLMHPKGLPWEKPAYPDLANKLIHKMRG